MSDENGRSGRRAFIRATGALGVGAGAALASGASAAAATGPGVGIDNWTNIGAAVILNPGGSFPWFFTFAGDPHVQIAGPNILQPWNNVKHTYFNFGKAKDANGNTTYFVTIRNDGGAAATHNLQGGGLT